MFRVLSGLLALSLFVAAGYFTRPYFREWLDSNMKEASAASKKETANWKAATTKFGDVKLGAPVIDMPKIDLPKSGTGRPGTNVIR